MTTTITLNGAAIHDIASFYAEINRVFMAGEDWQLGDSLDAFNDALYGGFGPIKGAEPVRLIWRDMEKSRAALGLAATRNWLAAKLDRSDIFDTVAIRQQLDDLETGKGSTYFDILLEIIADHANIELIAA